MAVVVPSGAWWGVAAGVAVVVWGVVAPVRVAEWDVVVAAAERDVVHCEQFADPAQRRRARRWCEQFLAVSEKVSGNSGSARLRQVEELLWRALVALRESLAARDALARVENRAGLAAELAESTRALADLDRRLDEFADALRIAHEEGDDPERAIRRLAALDPIQPV